MRTFKTVVIPATAESTKEVEDKTLCDLCGEQIKQYAYDVAEAHVSLETGVRYPEGGEIKEVSFDICVECFVSKVVPWLVSQGATPRIEERHW